MIYKNDVVICVNLALCFMQVEFKTLNKLFVSRERRKVANNTENTNQYNSQKLWSFKVIISFPNYWDSTQHNTSSSFILDHILKNLKRSTFRGYTYKMNE